MSDSPTSKNPAAQAAQDDVQASMRAVNANTDNLGQSQIFTPTVINDIHVKSELGRYRMRGFSMFKKIPHWDELVFLPGTLTRFVIEGYREKCETKTVLGARFAKKPLELDIPVYITRHELRGAINRSQDGAGQGCIHGGLCHLFWRGRHDSART